MMTQIMIVVILSQTKNNVYSYFKYLRFNTDFKMKRSKRLKGNNQEKNLEVSETMGHPVKVPPVSKQPPIMDQLS